MLQEPHVRVLELLAEEKSLSRIATELGYKQQTVKNYLMAIYGRLGVQTRGKEGRRDAVAIARERGVIPREVERSAYQEH
jgi:DNA-binding CsgD family transcriptional regulator